MSTPRNGARPDAPAVEPDSTTTATFPAVGGDAGGSRPYPRSPMPGAGGPERAAGPDRSGGPERSGSDAGASTTTAQRAQSGQSAPATARTEVVTPVPPPRSPFADAPGGLPPRPGAASGVPPRSAASPGRPSAVGIRSPRRAQLTLRRFNVWSVFKFSCILAIALFFVWIIGVGVLYGTLQASGVVSSINNALGQISPGGAQILQVQQVFGVAALVGAVNVLLFIALSTLFSVIYNLCADLVGGVEVTLSERE